MSKWISVKDKPIPVNQFFWFRCGEDKPHFLGIKPFDSKSFTAINRAGDGALCQVSVIEFWMPLPEPPNE